MVFFRSANLKICPSPMLELRNLNYLGPLAGLFDTQEDKIDSTIQDHKIGTGAELSASIYSYQGHLDDYRYRVLSKPRAEVEELADLFTVESEEDAGIKALLHRVKYGSYSDLSDPSAPFCGSVRPYPAYDGLHVNEDHNRCLSSTSNLSLDVWVDKSASNFRRSPLTVPLEDLHLLTAGLPGHHRDALGVPSPFKTSCGAELPHGSIKATLDGENLIRAPEQFIHCSSRRCPKCLRYNTFIDSDDSAQRVWADYRRECRRGALGAVYHLVLSPPQAHKDRLAVYRWLSKEGYDDLKKSAILFLKELGALGGAVVAHHFRENGEDGAENAEITGNDQNPDNWRLALHFHALAVFDRAQIFDFKKVAEISRRSGWVIKLVTSEDPDAMKGGRVADRLRASRIKTLLALKKKMFYLMSHASILLPDDGGRALDSISYFGGATHRRLRELYGPSGRPLYLEGYTQIDDEGRVLYWYNDLARFVPSGLEALAEVERVNSARVYVDAADYTACIEVIHGLRRDLHLSKGEDIPPADLYRAISSDPRFITAFEPMAEPQRMRPPRKMQLDGRELWIFREAPGDSDLYATCEDYRRYCQEADAREAEYNEQRARLLSSPAFDDLDDFKVEISARYGGIE